jgi:hypothetical protein
LTFGDYVLFGSRIGIYTSNHAIDAGERTAGACYAKPVTIGNRVWVGGGVNINQGMTVRLRQRAHHGPHQSTTATLANVAQPPDVVAAAYRSGSSYGADIWADRLEGL